MNNDPHIHLTSLCRVYAAHMNLSHWRVAFLARGDGQFFRRLADGKSCTVKTATTVVQWFSDHWPDDLEWPPQIPRPATSKEAA